jgi:penicillin-binding protein 1C
MQKYFKLKNRRVISLFVVFLLIFIFHLWTNPLVKQPGTIKIYDRNNILLYESAGMLGKRSPIPYNHLPKHLINAAIASEDNTYWSNHGVDLGAIFRSLLINTQHGSIVTGASTITQQVARATVIAPGKIPSRTMLRKIQEIIIAFRLSMKYSKQDILSLYFNSVYFGNLSYGVQSAAQTYFAKDASQLSLAESALLVGLLSNPETRNPFTNIQGAKKQQAYVLDLMVKQHMISRQQANEAKHEAITLSTNSQNIKAPHFVQYVLADLDRLGINSNIEYRNSKQIENTNDKNSGLHVYTTLDYPTYRTSEDIARLWIDKLRNDHDVSNAAIVLLNNHTGEILSMLGGVDYMDATHSGQVNMATSLRQPGSAIKPITYATAFMQGYTPATLIYDIKKVYQTKTGEGFTPNNYDGRFHGMVLAREALASSLNVPAVEMLNRIGIPNFLKTARALGMTTLYEDNRYDVSLTLGGGEVTLMDLTNVFASFARGGALKVPFGINSITTDSGKRIYKHKDNQSLIALGENSQQIAYLISDILSDPKARIAGFGEKNPLVLSHPAAVKTGTTTDWHDNWTIGYTPTYTVGVWVGNNDNHAMQHITGVTGAAPIWNQFFEEFLKGKPVEAFTKPEKITAIEVCSITGKLPDKLCPQKKTEQFIQGTEPKERSNIFKQASIDIRNNLLAGSTCSHAYIKIQTFINYPPEVYTWAVQNSQPTLPHDYSPLCSGNQSLDGQSYITIIYPKEKTVFESAPLMVQNQAAVFEVNVSQDITKVAWYIDGKLTSYATTFPFSTPWPLLLGKHSIIAKGISSSGTSIQTSPIHISVVDYQADK